MSILDIQIDKTRQNQGEAIKSKDWEQVRNKIFQEDELLWNDSQFIINGKKENLKIQQNIQIEQNQDILQRYDSDLGSSQIKSISFKNQNGRKFQYISKLTSSRSRTIEIDTSNFNEISRINQIDQSIPTRDQRNDTQCCESLQTNQNNNNIRTNNFKNYPSKAMIWVAKLKLRLKNFKLSFNKTKESKLLSSEMRLMINDSSDSIEEKETFFKTLEKCCSKFTVFNYLKKIPLYNLSSKSGFYIKLILVWLNIIYLLLFSIFIVFQVDDDFSKKVFQIINIVWLIELIFNLNSQIQQDMEIITSRGRAFLIYIKKKLLFDLVPLILNSQFEHTSSALLFQVFQFLKLLNIIHDLKYVELQLCMRVKKHYLIQLINLIFGLFFIGHIISCLWFLIGYVEINYLKNQKSWLADDMYTDAFWWQIYFSSLYWSLTLMSTGSNICSANLEIMFTVIIMLFTSISFGYIVTIIGDILSEMNSNDLKRKQDMNVINNYMRQSSISKELQANVNLYMQQYYQNNFQEEKQNKQLVVSKLSIDLQESLKREQYKEIISQIDILFNKIISYKALQDIALYIEEEFYLPNQKLKIDNTDQSLLFIIQGEVEFQTSQGEENINSNYNKKKLGAGKNFGFIEFISGISQNHGLKSTMFTQITFIEDLKKLKDVDILEQFNITLSDEDEESISVNNNSDQQQKLQLKQSQKEFDSNKNSQNNISQKVGENCIRKHSIFVINKQSQDIDDQQNLQDSNSAYKPEQSNEKLNINGFEAFLQNSITLLNDNQRITVKEFDKCMKQESENSKISEEKFDSMNTISQKRKQPHQTTSKSIKNISYRQLQRASCFFENLNHDQNDNFKQEMELQANVNLYMQQYYQNNFQEEKQNKQLVVSKLSIDLQESLKREQYKEIISQIDILFNKIISYKALQDIALYIEEEFYLPNQKLKIDNTDQSLLFIIQGEHDYQNQFVEIQTSQGEENVHGSDNKKKLGAGKNFGLIEFISGISKNHGLKSTMFTQIVKINRTDFIRIIKENDQEYQKFCELKDKILFYSNFQDLNMKCNFCHSFFHQDLNCKLVNFDKNQIYISQSVNQQETQKRVFHQRNKIKNINPLYIQSVINHNALTFIEDLKKLKFIDVLEQFNITLSDEDEESVSDNNNSDHQQKLQQKQSQKELDSKKNSQNNISQKGGENCIRKQSIFVINKQSAQDLDDQHNQQESNSAYKQEQSTEKLNLNGFEAFVQNSITLLNENQRITVKEFDKCMKQESENTKISEEKFDSMNTNSQKRKQPHQTTSKSIKKISYRQLQRASCFFENLNHDQNDNFKQEMEKLMENFKLLNQTIANNGNNQKDSAYFLTQESNIKNIQSCQSQMMYYDFDILKDYAKYFPLGNSKEVIFRLKNQIKKKFKRANVSFLFQYKI
ncbi:cation channel family transporter (macronuclear) [Tetrahymena thermophila SB210]|uniref:Cation channel family transporter n=1 Tax=Tetrahymena thermophila (strain SB210) TaxID=312017 RepID=Q22YI7_TETTS|nr:cation channel family transporter [Tetrahymena thermophila SB210]EAR90298.2 cation channel family transporter [Tetrahymena thermophila SB210]|eukprot:XP_001010543.2 cation channel family transporter [Tetrahymena thermophila SB210]